MSATTMADARQINNKTNPIKFQTAKTIRNIHFNLHHRKEKEKTISEQIDTTTTQAQTQTHMNRAW